MVHLIVELDIAINLGPGVRRAHGTHLENVVEIAGN